MEPDTRQSQFQLLKTRRFLPFFLTQFSGAFNDNLFKNALLVLVVGIGAAQGEQAQTNTLTNLALALFSLPFFLFSPIAGQLADKYEKSAIIRRIKVLEIWIMAAGTFALWSGNIFLLMVVLFAMGAQSAFFGPIKYSIIPQHLRIDELVAGNAQVELGTFVAILAGTIGGSLLGARQPVWLWVGPVVLGAAMVGWLCSRYIPRAPSPAPDLGISWNFITETVALVRLAAAQHIVFLAILGISWYWLLGAAYLTQTPNFVVTTLGGKPGVIALLLSALTIGIGTGSLLCDRLSGHKVEIGLVPLGSLGLSLFGIDLYFSAGAYQASGPVDVASFFSQSGAARIFIDLLLIGVFGGFFIVPLYALIQARTRPESRARVIAANNIFNALFIVLAGLLGIALLGWAELSIPEFMLVLALMNIAVALFIFQQVPEFTMRFLIWLLSHTMYRVSHRGLDHIPDRGAAIIVCNHVSYVDALLLAGAVRRPIRFIMHKPIYELPVLNFIFRTGGAIPICSRSEDEEAYQRAMDAIAEALARGHLLCIFPEGRLTRDGEMGEFREGIERILKRTPVPVIPVALRGLWGSFFSHRGPGVFRNPFRRVWSRVAICAAEEVPPEAASATGLHDRVLALRGECR